MWVQLLVIRRECFSLTCCILVCGLHQIRPLGGTCISISSSTGYRTCAFHIGVTSNNKRACCCASTLSIRLHGRLVYPLSSAQLIVNTSMVTTIGYGLQLVYTGSWCVSLLANRSTYTGPSPWLIWWNIAGHSGIF